ncbi:MAG: nuclear transport factor 2 family protein [Flavobacteriales bacterium]|nr:nuclear transport factor 2 family protein [Flavobacteriales bacterium]
MRCLLYMCLFIAVASCQRAFLPTDEAAIRQVMADQEEAWDAGDIPGFMEGYADSVCFISPKKHTCGKAGVTANYLNSYPDKATMGDLFFDGLEVVPAGAEHAWVTGRWQLFRVADTLGGGFSLLWERDAEGWRILRDHTY